MNERGIHARLNIISGMKRFKNDPSLLPLSRELVVLARNAYTSYQTYLDQQKEEKERNINEAKKKQTDLKKCEEAETLKELAKELVEKQKTEEEKQKAAEKLFVEANKRLESGMKRKNPEEIILAQGMLHGVKMLRMNENKATTEAVTIAKKIQRPKKTEKRTKTNMDFKKAETLKSKGKKILKQPSIVNFFDQETQQKFMKKHYSTPIKNNSNSSFTSDKTPLSPIENVIYPSPVVNLNAIEKNRDFYSMEEFLEDMNTTAFKKALFTVEERFENYSTDEKFDALKKSTNQTIKKVTKARESYHWLDNKKSDSDMETTDTESYTSNFDSDESVRDSDKLDFEDVPRNMENLENFPKNMENLEVTKLLLKKAKQRTLRTSRLPNEIQTVSQVCPILFRDPPKQDLRHALQDLGITKPFSRYTFNRCLEDFGAEMVSNYFKDVNVQTNNLKSCFYCGYQTESSLVMGSHLDKKHKQMFKKWPFSDRLDVKPVY